jgi:AcrR family transcriptional regulator
MRVSREEKNRSHERIVASAARLLRTGGVEGASIGDVMSDAGLTHGAFDRHFDAKDAMVAAATARLAAGFEGSEVERRDKAARKLAMLVGAVVIARASDPETGRAVLDACRKAPGDRRQTSDQRGPPSRSSATPVAKLAPIATGITRTWS